MVDRYDAVTPREASNGKTYFTKVGVAFANRSGNGYTLILEAYPLPDKEGQVRVLLMEPKERDDRGSDRGDSRQESRGARSSDSRSDKGVGRMRREPEVSSGRPQLARARVDDDPDSDIPF
jgi:hypothetical protein